MGCTQSKIENEETVNRCKERKQYMERAVAARNKFAAAHSAHAMSLKNTGAALSDYAQGEVVYPAAAAAAAGGGAGDATLQPPLPPYDNFPLPPPPLPPSFNPTSSQLQRASTVPELRPELKHSNTIIQEENEEDIDNESTHSLKHRSSKSSGRGSGGGRGGLSHKEVTEDEVLQKPPSPMLPNEREREHPVPPPPPVNKDSSWDYFFSPEVPVSTLADVEDDQYNIEKIQRKMREERAKKSEMDGEVDGGKKVEHVEAATEVVEGTVELPPQPSLAQAAVATKLVKRVKMGASSEGKMKGGPSNTNLLQIFVDLDDCFLKACESAHDVSRLLEANRLHYHSNFADKRGHIDHSTRVMRVITWNRSFKGLPNADDGVDDFDSEEHETHATVLDKMLAWEKKLYDEVKAGEQMKLEYQKKVASLNKLKKHGSNTDALERMKAAVSHLHTRYIVDMQSMDSTVSEINSLRDDQLYPKLVVLVDAMAIMWETMKMYHEKQSKIVQALRPLDISQSPKETSDRHHERTRQLCGVVQEWHSHFSEFMSQQKEYIKALKNWLKLNLIPIDTNLKEKVSSPRGTQNPPILTLLHSWNEYLEKIPDEPTKATINNFAAVIQTIWQYQKDELDLRNKCAESSKELMKRTREFDTWYNKYMQRRTPPDEMDADREPDKDFVAERQQPVEAAKLKLKSDEEAYQRQCIQLKLDKIAEKKLDPPLLPKSPGEKSPPIVTNQKMHSTKHSGTQPLLSDSQHQEPPYVVVLTYQPPHTHRVLSKSCRRSLICFATLLPFLVAAAYLLWPSDPDLSITRLRLDRLHFHTSPKISLDITLDLTIKVRNKDFYSIDYDSLLVAIGYRGKRLGSVMSNGGDIKVRGTSYINATLVLDGVEILSDVILLLEDLAKGAIPFDMTSQISGRFGMFFFDLPLKTQISCEVIVNTRNQKIARQSCYPEIFEES
ncbi:unnamed protein product [Fraxinus pennsylvanica]|uniref:Late embryogenesis abundant protein LEA-2 subgroup domain-containing protein n=1 Tax=Fraxinus pennsylvanica TaxID=56036 RepID=A0AAD1YQ32_9LAMI|nr:unnamed protein product [Fraxinus pennsylvanica]